MMRQAMPLDKTPQFNNISDWTTFKKKLITKFADIPIFACKAHSDFNLRPVYKSVQELAENPAPTVTHKDGVTAPSAPTVNHENGVTTLLVPTVTQEDGVTTPSAPTVTL